MAFFEVFATVHLGAAIAALGSADGVLDIARGIETNDAIGANVIRVWFLVLLAEAHLKAGNVTDAQAVLRRAFHDVEEFEASWLLADVCRLNAAVQLRTNDATGSEASLERAIDVARQQQAKSFELRACTDLARLWRDQGKGPQARELLLPVFDWFSEGFDTPDLLGAKALLDDLS